MRIVTVGVLCGLVTGCVVPPGLHMQQAAILRGVPVVPAVIDGVETLCVIDTSTPALFLSTRFGGVPWTGLGQPDVREFQSLVVANWQFSGGALTASDAVFDDWRARLGLDGVDCWLGTGLLGSMQLTVDYAGGYVELAEAGVRPFTPGGLTGEVIDVDTFASDGRLLGVLSFDDLDGIALLDTGASLVRMEQAAYDDLSDPPEVYGEPGARGRLETMGVGQDLVQDVLFEVRDDGRLPRLADDLGLRVDGSAGATFLAGYAVTFDFPGERVTLRPYEPSVRTSVLAALDAELAVP